MTAPDDRIVPYATDRRRRVAVAALAGIALALDLFVLTRQRGGLVVLGTLVVSVVVLVALGPGTWRRVRGLMMVPEVNRTLVAFAAKLEAGEITEAHASIAALAKRLGDGLGAYRFVVLSALAYARMHIGDAEGARALLDHLEASGWLDARAMRKSREPLLAGHLLARTQLGDLERARALAARLGPDATTPVSRAARLVLAARLGRPDADAMHAFLGEAAVAGQTSFLRLVRLALVASLAADDPRRPAHVEALRAGGRRALRALRDGWPALYALARELDLVDEAV